MPIVTLVGGPCDGRVVEIGALAHRIVVPVTRGEGPATWDYEVYAAETGQWLGPEKNR